MLLHLYPSQEPWLIPTNIRIWVVHVNVLFTQLPDGLVSNDGYLLIVSLNLAVMIADTITLPILDSLQQNDNFFAGESRYSHWDQKTS